MTGCHLCHVGPEDDCLDTCSSRVSLAEIERLAHKIADTERELQALHAERTTRLLNLRQAVPNLTLQDLADLAGLTRQRVHQITS